MRAILESYDSELAPTEYSPQLSKRLKEAEEMLQKTQNHNAEMEVQLSKAQEETGTLKLQLQAVELELESVKKQQASAGDRSSLLTKEEVSILRQKIEDLEAERQRMEEQNNILEMRLERHNLQSRVPLLRVRGWTDSDTTMAVTNIHGSNVQKHLTMVDIQVICGNNKTYVVTYTCMKKVGISCRVFSPYMDIRESDRSTEAAAVSRRNDDARFQEDLLNIARTTLSSKLLTHHKDHFSHLAVKAVMRLKGSGNLEAIHVIKKLGGSLTDSYLDEGFLLDKKIGVNQPKRLENVNILIANTGMDTDKIKIFGSRVRVDSMAKVAEIELAEKEKMKEKVDRILKHGINCFINRQLIYNYPEQLFAQAGVMAIEHADFAGVERLALVTGGEITSTFDHPELVKLGHCKLIEEVMIGEDLLIHFSGVDMGEACTIVLRGATQQIVDEAERSLHDALCVLAQTVKEPRTVYGGGCSEMLMAKVVTDLANKTPGKEAVAMESFAKALRMLPTIIADNAGYDSADLVAQLRAAHQENKTTSGLNMSEGTVGDMAEMGITESFQVKRQVLLSASEAAEMILRVDDIIKAAPRKRVPDHHPC
ncbi:T-complex protein 1 subunit beta [Solea senegalensis]|uniref:CCT-beta n=1 Tax=Solea senegalensis TaxID=28829 RepID=A0AAV6R0J4_SOLSE|nr:T-complex protein 1 subunit beta [Solea senegalensis]